MMHFLHYSPSPVCSPGQGGRTEASTLGVCGEAEGVCPVLILHGRGGSSASWTKIGQGLADAGHDVWIPDLAGHGQTPLPHAYTIDDYTTDIIDFIPQTIQHAGVSSLTREGDPQGGGFVTQKGRFPQDGGVGTTKEENITNNEKETNSPNHQTTKVLIIAHSNGGRIALHLAATHPELVQQLILVNSAGIDLSYDPSRYRTIKRIVFPSIAKIMKYIIPQKLLSPLYRLLGGHDYLATAHDPYLRETFVTMLHTELENDMQNIDTQTMPTTLIRGGCDSYTPLRQGKRMHHLIAGSKLTVYEKERHGIHLHNPTLLIKKIITIIGNS